MTHKEKINSLKGIKLANCLMTFHKEAAIEDDYVETLRENMQEFIRDLRQVQDAVKYLDKHELIVVGAETSDYPGVHFEYDYNNNCFKFRQNAGYLLYEGMQISGNQESADQLKIKKKMYWDLSRVNRLEVFIQRQIHELEQLNEWSRWINLDSKPDTKFEKKEFFYVNIRY